MASPSRPSTAPPAPPSPMRRGACLLACVVALALGGPAAAEPLGLAAAVETGAEDGPLARIGAEVASALVAAGIAVRPGRMPGAFAALVAARTDPAVQLAVVPGDVPAYLARRAATAGVDPAGLGALGAEMAEVSALAAVPLHLVARGDVRRIEDIDGRRVGIGPADGPVAVTAALLLDAAGVRSAMFDTSPPESALAALLAGRIDAVFLAGTAPVPLLARAVDGVDGLRLLPLAPVPGVAAHEPATIPAGRYSWAPEATPTLAVRASLVAYRYPESGETCARLAAVAEAVAEALAGALAGRGGSGAAGVGGFAPHPCAAAVAVPAPASGTPGPADPLAAALGGPAAAPVAPPATDPAATGQAPGQAASAAPQDAPGGSAAPDPAAGPAPGAAADPAEQGRRLMQAIGSLFGGGEPAEGASE